MAWPPVGVVKENTIHKLMGFFFSVFHFGVFLLQI